MLTAFDIETGPLEDLPPFDRGTVKLGNLKDPVKIAEKIAQAEVEYREKAALSALTGQVLCIGIMEAGEEPALLTGDESSDDREAELLGEFWRLVSLDPSDTWAGHYSNAFDLPFLYRRSLILGVDVPDFVINRRGHWSESFVDLMDVWRCGDRQLFVKLDALAAAFGIPGKTAGVDGADFARLWKEERPLAVEYAKNDARVTLEIAMRMGF